MRVLLIVLIYSNHELVKITLRNPSLINNCDFFGQELCVIKKLHIPWALGSFIKFLKLRGQILNLTCANTYKNITRRAGKHTGFT